MRKTWKKRRSKYSSVSVRLVCISAILLSCSLALADWDPGDPALFYQLPNPNGWDVYSEWQYGVANDWTAEVTAPITDIHFWGSWKNDVVGTTGEILLRIRSNKTQGVSFTQPDGVLWQRVITEDEYTSRLYTTGDQGWYDPRQADTWEWDDHNNMYQYNISTIDNPFIQQAGQTYWLEISMDYSGCEWGWKTTLDMSGNTSVFFDRNYTWAWQQLKEPSGWCWPNPPQPLDVAFVLTTPEPVSAVMFGLGAVILSLRRRR